MTVALNNHNAAVNNAGLTAQSAAFSVTAGGQNLCAVARALLVGTSLTGATATYNGVSMNLLTSPIIDTTANNFVMVMFYLVAPSTGSNTLTVTRTGSGTPTDIYMDLTSYTGVDQTTPVRAGSIATNDLAALASSIALTIPSDSSDMTTTICTTASGGTDISGTSATPFNSTLRSHNAGGSICMGSDDAPGAASVVVTWAFAANTVARAVMGFSLQAAPPVPSTLLLPPFGSYGSGGMSF